MDAIHSSETSDETQQNTRRHIPKDDIPHNTAAETSNPTYFKVISEYLEGISR
jgi:hypothetical protein